MATLTAPSDEQLAAVAKDQVVLITGGASGIGLATAKMFARAEAKVLIVDVGEEDRLAKIAASIGNGATHYRCDVTSWTSQVKMFDEIVEKHGRVDIAFLNAGLHLEMQTVAGGEKGEEARKRVDCDFLAEELDEASGALKKPSMRVFDVNLFGVCYGMKLAVHAMKRQVGGGRIVATVSANAYLTQPSSGFYDASKHAVLGLVRSTAQRADVQASHISISALCPSLTWTAMTDMIAREYTQHVRSSEPEDVARAVAYLVTTPCKVTNGQTVLANGKELFEIEASYQGWSSPIFSN